MLKLSRFWRSFETVVGLSAVRAVWKQALGPDLSWARPLLRATGQAAPTYPKLEADPASPLAYRVVMHDAATDDIVGICPDGTGRIALKRDQLAIYALDVKGLAALIAAALKLTPDPAEVPALLYSIAIGTRDPLGPDEHWVYLTLAPDARALSAELDHLAARSKRPFTVLTPTRSHWSSWAGLERGVGRVVAMEEVFGGLSGGALMCTTELFAATAPQTPSGEPAGKRPIKGIKGAWIDASAFAAGIDSRMWKCKARSKRPFYLLERITRNPGHRIMFDQLRAAGDVWDDSQVEDVTIRGTATRLPCSRQPPFLSPACRPRMHGSTFH